MPTDNYRSKYFWQLSLTPAIGCCVIVILGFAYLKFEMYDFVESNRNKDIATLLKNIDISEHSSFETLCKRLMQATALHSIALIDKDLKPVHSQGKPLEAHVIEQTIGRGTWHGKEKNYFATPTTYVQENVSKQGWVLFVGEKHDQTKAIVLSLWYSCFVLAGMFVLLFYFNRRAQLRTERSHDTNGEAIRQHLIEDLKDDDLPYSINDADNSTDNNPLKVNAEIQPITSTLIASDSHESINDIISFIELLKKTSLDSQQRGYLNTIEHSIKKLRLNESEVTDYSLIDSGKLEYKLINIRELVETSQKFALVEEAYSDAKFSIEFCDKIPEKLLGDPLRIQQIYVSLLASILQVSQSRQLLTTVEQHSCSNKDDEKITIKISIRAAYYPDTKAAEQLQTVLLYAQEAKQTGQGNVDRKLGAVKELLEKMHGQIGLDLDKEDQELCLWFTIMLEQPKLEQSDSSIQDSKTIKVLVVDDYLPNRKLLCELLCDMGVDAENVQSGELAIERCKQTRYTLVLMDVKMPGLNGLETTKIIRSNEGVAARTPIVALTADAVDEEKSSILLAGMDDFLSKPIGEAELRELLQRWTNYDRPRPAAPSQPNPLVTFENSPEQVNSNLVDIEASIKLAKGNVDLAKDMLSMLLSGLESELTAMESAWQQSRHQELHEIVHRIHGGACYCGIPNLLSASSTLDQALKDAQHTECEAQFNTLVGTCKELVIWYRSHNLEIIFNSYI